MTWSETRKTGFLTFWFLSHLEHNSKEPVQPAVLPEPSLIAHTRYGSRLRLLPKSRSLGQIFLLVDLHEFFFRSRVGGRKKINKKALKMTS